MFSILGYDFADKGYYINLKKSKERKKNVESQIKKYDIKDLNRFPALTDDFIQFSCTKSHLSVIEKSLKEGHDSVFIAEDDFQILDECYYPINKSKKIDFKDLIKNLHKDLKNEEWDVFLFGCNPKTHIIPLTENLGINSKSTGAWAYIIKKNTFKYIIENLNYRRDFLAIDDYLPHLSKKGFKVLTSIPMSIGHAVGYVSTLQPKGKVNYTDWINGNYHKFLYDNIHNKELHEIQKNITIIVNCNFTYNHITILNKFFDNLPEDIKKCRFIIRYNKCDGSDKVKLGALFRDVLTDFNIDILFESDLSVDTLDKVVTPYLINIGHDNFFKNETKFNIYDILLNIIEKGEDTILIDDYVIKSQFFNKPSIEKTTEKKIKEQKKINDMKRNILFKFPSRGRPDKFKETLTKHLNFLSGENNYKFIFSFDIDDSEMNNDDIRNFISKAGINHEIFYENNKTKIEAINNNLKNQNFDILVLISDDMVPAIENYDKIIVEHFNNNGLDNVLHVYNYTWEHRLDIWCIMGKKYYDRFNYIYQPEYKSIFCDNEYTETAKALNKVIYCKDALFLHDYLTTDETAQKNNHFNIHDENLYNERKKNNFYIKNI